MAGGAGSRLDVLTERRAKPAMPYGGMYRLIDFPLSNCMHSGIENVWIVQQYQPHALNDHVSNGRPWDLDRTYGGLRILHPHLGDNEGGFHQGNADAIWRNAGLIHEHDPDVLLVLSADHVYTLDYREVVAHHLGAEKDVTIVTTDVGEDDASRFGVVVSEDGNVAEYDYKPEAPKTSRVATEVFAFTPGPLLDRLEHLAAAIESGDDDSGLEDLGDDLLPWMVENKRAAEFRLEGYWRDLGTVSAYWAAHMDLLSDPPDIDLGDPRWPVHTVGTQRPPARIHTSAANENTLLSPGCSVYGEIARSVLGPGVVIEDGAVVRDSVLLQDCHVEAGATIENAIIDTHVRVGRDSQIGAPGTVKSGDDLVVIGMEAIVRNGSKIEAGGRIEPG